MFKGVFIGIIALTLVFSVFNSANPVFFVAGPNSITNLQAFADSGSDDDNDNSGQGGGNDDEEEEDNDQEDKDNESKEEEQDEHDNDEEHNEDEQLEEDEEEHEDDNEEDKGDDEERDEDEEQDKDSFEGEFAQSNIQHSKAEIKTEEGGELEIEIEEGELSDGTYNVTFSCSSPEIHKEFGAGLVVEDGEGEFEAELMLLNNTYAGCRADVEDQLSALFSPFTIIEEHEVEEEADEEGGAEEEDTEVEENEEHEHKSELKFKIDDNEAELKLEIEGLELADGQYDAVFSCAVSPIDNHTFAGGFEVEDGEGELESEFTLANGVYDDCHITIAGLDPIDLGSFTVDASQETEFEVKQDSVEIEEKRKERKHAIVSAATGVEIHHRHLQANPVSTGHYEPGAEYSLTATGTTEDNDDNTTNAELAIELAVWKSNQAIILFDVLGGTVQIQNTTYDVVLGYGLYSDNSDIIRIRALVMDDTGDVLTLKLRGEAMTSSVEEESDQKFPAVEGESLDLVFEGNSGPSKNALGDWELFLDGLIHA